MMVMKKEQETMKREALITDDTGISSGFAAQFFNIFSSPPRFQHFLSFLLLLASLFHRLQCFTIYTVSCLKLFCTHNMWTFTKALVWLIVYNGREKVLENGLSPQFCISWPLPCRHFSQPYFQDQSPFFSIWCFFVCGGCSWAQTLFLLISPMGNGHHLLRLYRPIFYRFSFFLFLLIFLTFIVDFCLSSQV